uniref:N-acetyltransferase domain-containing protein n=1 Tax=Meloidogyne enterolobii TaxID=390850 RepID=A0A6V7XDB7_MELEN|nr:unnamed protein product [Meloidogyne enterolobii]
MFIYVAAHYKNSPDDLQLLSDAPAHHLFVLMSPIASDQNYVPQEQFQKQTVISKQGKKVAGDLIPWTICQQFLDSEFSLLYGARIVRLAVHPDFQGMGYGSAAIRMLQKYFRGDFGQIQENGDKLDRKGDDTLEEDMEGIEEEEDGKEDGKEDEEEDEEETNDDSLNPSNKFASTFTTLK